ncbi:hypothetical protein A2397_04695 [Candidatus Amesbacteria bacterium RIFOXYB1_FULL_44_23]|uniref:DUF5667 domain-containing protein n=1 Tax=Candidatus Amesbacteria bacterium RIFOXYB1_FULL_44_23 TaxID=1797263 RepID=A0A1F4ZQH0_9BACT|nr:MAG: hypothetical protein A2397_04695 [Candidatus Amesbacteria bacterium RIFOXYB1_FULL_44_23]
MITINNKLLVFALLILLFSTASVRSSKAVGNPNQLSVSPTGKTIQNRNEVTTQNQGQDSKLQIETNESQMTRSASAEGAANRSQNAVQNMSLVAQKVQEMLQIRTTGGIGDQVRQIARDQNQAQTQTQNQLQRIDSKGGVAKFFFGPDYGAIKELQGLTEQNRLRIQQLQQLQTQLANSGDQTLIQATIQALEQQNTSLQNRLNAENQTFSLFGWLAKFLIN